MLSETPQWPVSENLADPPSLCEVHHAIRLLSNGKAPGTDSNLPAEVFKYGGMRLTHRLVHLFPLMWCEEQGPKDFKDASIIHLYKRKGSQLLWQPLRHFTSISSWQGPTTCSTQQTVSTCWQARDITRESVWFSHWSCYHRHDLVSMPITGEMSRTVQGPVFSFHWSHKGIRLCEPFRTMVCSVQSLWTVQDYGLFCLSV